MPRKFKDRTGEIHITNEGYPIEIIENPSYNNCTVRFKNGHIIYNRQVDEVLKGRVKNPFHPSVYGVGYAGVGKYKKYVNKKLTSSYVRWCGILLRCYRRESSHRDVTVCREWLNYQNFAQWYEDNWKSHMIGWHIDKDILIKGNKIYSPNTCRFVPQEINYAFIKCEKSRGMLPIGVSYNKREKKFISVMSISGRWYFDNINETFKTYKEAKEYSIKNLATDWRYIICHEIYEAMMNYQVEITD